jgi:hypothetical protein
VIAIAGLVMFACWLVVGVAGTALGSLWPDYRGSLRLAAAALVVMAPSAVAPEIRERRLRRIPYDERLGFATHPSGGPTVA